MEGRLRNLEDGLQFLEGTTWQVCYTLSQTTGPVSKLGFRVVVPLETSLGRGCS